MVPPVITETKPPELPESLDDAGAKVALLRSLRHLVRGLSALFWGLPLTLLVCGGDTTGDVLRPLKAVPPMLTTGLLLYGMLELRHFRPQERPWRQALERAQIFACFNLGLAPFVFFWNRFPREEFFTYMVLLLGFTGLGFLICLNLVLQRLAAMLPDETLRSETQLFTSMNIYLVCFVFLAIGAFFGLVVAENNGYLPPLVSELVYRIGEARSSMTLFLILLPLAMTMTLIWKTKEVVLESVFSAER